MAVERGRGYTEKKRTRRKQRNIKNMGHRGI